MIPDFKTFIKESIWSDMQDRSAGDVVRQEDLIITNEELKNRIQELYIEQGEGDTLDVSSLTNIIKCDDFSYIFSGFDEVKHIIGLEDWDVSKVTNMYCMFQDCKNFNSDLSKWNVSSVRNMDSMFWHCQTFNSDLSKWDVSSVKYMGTMFNGCKKFNSDLSEWNVRRVGDMTYMFGGCKNFNSDLSKWDVSNVQIMFDMFKGCEKFNCDLSNWDVSNVKDMKDMFGGCKSLKQIPSWYMKEGLNESIWSDMQDRSSGEVVRKEDDIEHLDYAEFFTYLTKHYQPKSKKDNEKIGGRTPITNMDIIEIFIPIESIDDRIKTLMIVISKKDNSIVSIATSQTLFDKYVNLERTLSNNYILNASKNTSNIYIKPKKKPTNQTVVDLIDIFIAVVDNPILKKVS